ncbi:unnamed protein product, partial [Ectocarpus sp. 8 AP-2014]
FLELEAALPQLFLVQAVLPAGPDAAGPSLVGVSQLDNAADGLPGRRYLDVRRVRCRHFPPVLRRGLQGVRALRTVRPSGADSRQRHGDPERQQPGPDQHQHLQPAVHVKRAALQPLHVASRAWDVPPVRLGHVLSGGRVQVLHKSASPVLETKVGAPADHRGAGGTSRDEVGLQALHVFQHTVPGRG